MASRIQSKVLGLGLGKQPDIATISPTFLRFRQLNMELAPTGFVTETDAAEIGKGDEFASTVFPVSWNPLSRIDKYSSAEFMTWAFAYALGGVTDTTGTYTLVPIDPCADGLELPYFSVVEQVCESGGMALDNAFLGCAVEDVTYDFNYGPGRQSGRVTVNWVGSGKMDTPSGATVPPVVSEHYMLTGSMQATINGTNYITAKTILSGQIAWKNNLLVGPGFFPGSGMQNGAAVRGRLEIGARACTFTFTARLLKNSDEYLKLINPPVAPLNTATVTVTFDATHTVTFNFPAIQYETVVNGEQDGIVSVTVNVACLSDPSATPPVPPLKVTALCGITGIAQ